LPVKKELISAACVSPKERLSIQYPFKMLVSGAVLFILFYFILFSLSFCQPFPRFRKKYK